MAAFTRSSVVFLVVATLIATETNSLELRAKYPFNSVLFNDQGQLYEVYWNFSIAAGTIAFAVNVSTTGWVGFGVSPNGQMPGSDVVMGWIATDGSSYFHDRYAAGRMLPSIDSSQDWFLISGKEVDGFTTLEFTRNLTTCDSQDLDIKAETSRIIWSFSISDPTDSRGETAQFHNYQGSVSINLLGGLSDPPKEQDDLEFFDLTVSNVTIPASDTTYWCHSIKLPEDVQNATKYITKFSPVLTPHSRSFVHHVVVYQCTSPINESLVGESVPCHQSSSDIANCRARGGFSVAVWAVGGEDFVYPENVGYPIGGPGEVYNMVIEMHYDNPNRQENVTDSSGLRFFYVREPREHDAGVLYIGHSVFPTMIIPPGTDNYTISGVCGAQCTERYLPESGINIFANMLHTHLAGTGLVFQHIRWNSDCNVYEELAPIDINLNYDFNYQQTIHLPREVTVLPGDILVLKCFYQTRNNTLPTVAGESTREEMCLSFPLYYPRFTNKRNLDYCVSFPTFPTAFTPFQKKYAASNPAAAALWNSTGSDLEIIGNTTAGFYRVNWTPEAVQDFQNTILSGPIGTYCASVNSDDPPTFVNDFLPGPPEVNCSYEAADRCKNFEPLPCCERLTASSAPRVMWPSGQIIGSVSLLAVLLAYCLH